MPHVSVLVRYELLCEYVTILLYMYSTSSVLYHVTLFTVVEKAAYRVGLLGR